MATGTAEIRGHRSLLERLVVPRPITRMGLVIGAGLVGQLAWVFLPLPLMAYVSGVTASFCLLSAGAIWAMRDKADMAQDGDHLNAKQFKAARTVSKHLRHRATWRAAWVAICALAAASPAISQQFAEGIWQFMMIGAGIGVGEAAYGFMLANEWEEQLRTKRDDDQLTAKQIEERTALIERLEASGRPEKNGNGWSHVSEIQVGPTKPH